MSTHKNIDRICAAAVVLCLLLTLLFVNGEALGLEPASTTLGYETRLFDTSKVHTIDIVLDDWDGFLSTAQQEEYTLCSVVIDGDSVKNVAIRAKGNTSLSTVASMGSSRYSFKIEFDHYDSGKSYYGLDKLSLNNIIQDTTYMKDYLTYQLMAEFGVAAPLCSYAYLRVNGEDWGLYLAVEAVEESFLQRNYGSSYGELYKPDSMNMGGGRGNGKDFNMEDFEFDSDFAPDVQQTVAPQADAESKPGKNRNSGGRDGFSLNIDETALRDVLEDQGIDPSILDDVDLENLTMERAQELLAQLNGVDLWSVMSAIMTSDVLELPDFGNFGDFGGMGDDAKLQYIDDDPDSYSTIFDSAKTDITKTDQKRLIQSLKALQKGDAENAVDIDAVLRYFVVHNYVVNGDSYTGSMVHNYYLYEQDGLLSMIPWDYNLAFGTFQGNSASSAINDDIDAPLSVTGSGDRPMMDWILQNETYLEQYHQYFSEFLSTVDIQAIIDQAAELIDTYVQKDPTAFYSYDEFQTGVETLREFCRLRTESIQNQLDGGSGVSVTNLNLSDMGTMNNGGPQQGGDMPQMPDGMQQPDGEMPQIPDTMQQSDGEMPQMPDNMQQPNGEMPQMPDDMQQPNGEMPQMPDDMQQPNGEMPQMSNDMQQQSDATPQMQHKMEHSEQNIGQSLFTGLPLLLISLAVLVLGLLIALKFKPRG